MADKPKAVTAAELATWLSPRTAIKQLAHLDYRTAVMAIYRRLQGGKIRAFAQDSIMNDETRGSVLIDSTAWQYIAEGIAVSPFWQTGDITILVPDDRRDPMSILVSIDFFGVRFDPAGIQAMLPEPIPTPATQAPFEIDEPEEQRGPPVSDDLLRAWFDLYQKAYRGSHDTTENARKSATGMFPGKFVSRERIRQLRGPKKPGRKAKEGDG